MQEAEENLVSPVQQRQGSSQTLFRPSLRLSPRSAHEDWRRLDEGCPPDS